MLFDIISTCRNGDGYLYCRTDPPHPNAYDTGLIAEHRVIAENSLGRLLTSDEIVHHIDEDKHNNHPDNLLVITRSQHGKIHNPIRAKKTTITCPVCDEPFEITLRDYKARKKANKNGIFCSRSCGTKGSYISTHNKKWNHAKKLNEAQVIEIRQLSKSGIPNKELAKQFNLNRVTVSRIVHYHIWQHVA